VIKQQAEKTLFSPPAFVLVKISLEPAPQIPSVFVNEYCQGYKPEYEYQAGIAQGGIESFFSTFVPSFSTLKTHGLRIFRCFTN
jgi:hypothetical protein